VYRNGDPGTATPKQQIRFYTGHDGVQIAYATSCEGPPLVKVANWMSHLEFDLQSPVWSSLLAELSRAHTLIRYDERSCGLSSNCEADRDVLRARLRRCLREAVSRPRAAPAGR